MHIPSLSRSIGPIAALLLIAACQSVPAPSGFSRAQVQALRDNGFVPVAGGWEFGMADRLLFATDESRVIPDQAARIARIAVALRSVGITHLRVEGHTDSTGSRTYNEGLSIRRSNAVADVLAGGGLPRDGIVTAGLGEQDPIESNRTVTGRAENRRVVILVPAP